MADMLKRMPAQTSRLLKVLLAAVLALTLIPLMPTDEAYAASGKGHCGF